MKLMVTTDIYIVLKKLMKYRKYQSQREIKNELSTKYYTGVNIIGVIDNCLGVTAIVLSITGIGLL